MMDRAAQVTPSNSMREEDWLFKLETGTLTEADLVGFAQSLGPRGGGQSEIPWMHEVIGEGAALPQQQKLVRLLGMVHDQLDPEFYQAPSSSFTQLQERTPLVLAPFPTSPGWLQKVLCQCPSSSTSSSIPAGEGGASSLRRPSKRTRLNDAEEDSTPPEADAAMAMMEGDPNDDAEMGQASPQQQSVIAKLYYDQYHHAMGSPTPRARLNEILEIVGVLEPSQESDGGTGLGEYGIDRDDLSLQPQWSMLESPSGIDTECGAPPHLPRVHVLWYEPRDVDQIAAAATSGCVSSTSGSEGDSTRWGGLLSRALSVPNPCGQAIYMALLSMAERKAVPTDDSNDSVLWTPVETPHETTLGCASLNLVLPHAESCTEMQARLEKVLSNVVPQVVSLALDPRNVTGLLPAKKLGRMLPSPLQLPKGSVVILNASATAGVASLHSSHVWQALQQLTSHHQLLYSFEGIPLAFEADVRIIVLSTPTSQHVLPCTMVCRTVHGLEDNDSSTGSGLVADEDWMALRRALSRARSGALTASGPSRSGAYGGCRQPLSICVTNIGFAPQVLERAQNDFMQRRQQARKDRKPLANETDFHRWLTLTRLQARGRCVAMAEVCDWERAVSLDDEMRMSLQS